ncbi:MAG: ArsC/Spx/MgsR family protein [Candidatus Gracilibacteria bacterium]|nr:ArsC/Spx/MgsR family protein [Candidatus Gracilibacteria bacterium]
MYTFLHNSRCSKSRTGLKLMEKAGKRYELREYLKNPLDYEDLLELKIKLNLSAIDFTRTKEVEFKQANLTKNSTDQEILKAMAKFPKLMERPIVFNEKEAVIGRPEENIINFVK